MHQLLDPFDPRHWSIWMTEPERRVYGDDRASVWAVVDEVDYQWAVQFLWNVKKGRNTVYLKRNVETARTPVYLHVEIMKRTSVTAPSGQHDRVDHRNGDGRDCRRSNLRWATRSLNARNVRGCIPHDEGPP